MREQTQVRAIGRASVAAFTVLDVMSPRSTPTGASTFGAHLMALMDAAGYDSRYAFAQAAGMSHVNIGKWIDGTQTPSIDGLRKIAPLLNARLGDLMVRAGLATAAELGQVAPPLQPPLTPVERDIRARLGPKSPLNERQKKRLEGLLVEMVDMFDDVYAEVAAIKASRAGAR